MAMWSAIGNVFGFVVSAASVIAAVGKDIPVELLFLVLLTCFLGIAAIVSCFRAQKQEYIGLISKLAALDQMTLEGKLEEAQRVINAPNPVMIRERSALAILVFAVGFFLLFCYVSFLHR